MPAINWKSKIWKRPATKRTWAHRMQTPFLLGSVDKSAQRSSPGRRPTGYRRHPLDARCVPVDCFIEKLPIIQGWARSIAYRCPNGLTFTCSGLQLVIYSLAVWWKLGKNRQHTGARTACENYLGTPGVGRREAGRAPFENGQQIRIYSPCGPRERFVKAPLIIIKISNLFIKTTTLTFNSVRVGIVVVLVLFYIIRIITVREQLWASR